MLKIISNRKRIKGNGDDRGKWGEMIDKMSIIADCMGKIQPEVEWLKKVHDKTDEDGVYVWYVRKSLETSLSKLAENIEKQTLIMDRMWNEIKSSNHRIEKLGDILK